MTKDEALKLALEALQHEANMGNDDAYKLEREAIKEALAQPEPDWTPERIAGMARLKEAQDKKMAQLEQPKVRTGNCLRVSVCASEGHKIQPQRTWVGLTDEERNKLWREVIGWGDPSHDDEDLMKAIEAKLKEKNNG